MTEKITCVDRHGGLHEVDKSTLKTRISASGVLEHQGKYLMIQTPGSELWEFPGGGLELGETIQDALEREFIEETGYEVTMGNFITVREGFFFSDSSGSAYYTLRLFYEVLLKKQDQEIASDLLKSPNELKESNTHPLSLSVLKLFTSG